jgi:hydroxymethylpyrimidine pyrophosphatase-like HAD family hydrolase
VTLRLLATDLDGTLLRYNSTLSARSVAALRAADDAGLHVVIATGRHWEGCVDYVEQVGVDVVQHVLCVNGAELRASDGTIRAAEEVPVDAVVAVVTALRAALPGVSFGIDRGGEFHGEPATIAALPGGFELPAPVPDVLDYIGPDLRDIVVYHPDFATDLEGLHARVLAVAPPTVAVGFSGLPMIEVVSAETDKGKTLARLCAELGVDRTEVVAFGDQRNDLGMFTFAGLALATENAHPDVRRAADGVIGHHDDDAVARWIEANIVG